MEFSVLNDQTIQCVLSEEEMADFGMDRHALLQNDERVRNFFNQVMRQAEMETGFRKKRGDVTVHASFLSDESLEITFFIQQKDVHSISGTQQNMSKMPRVVSKHAASPANEHQEKGLYEQSGERDSSGKKEETIADVDGMAKIATAVLKSRSLMTMIDFSEKAYTVQSDIGLKTWLYKYKDVYFMLADIRKYGLRRTAVLFNLSDEYMDGVCHTEGIAAFLREHGTCVIAGNAMEVLGKL